MKETRSLVNRWLVCGIALAMASTLSAQTLKEQTAKVVRVKGKARFMPKGGDWQPLMPGRTLTAGSVIQTGMDKDSYVDVLLGRGTGGAELPPPTSGDLKPPGYVGGGGAGGAVFAAMGETVVRLFENTVVSLDKLLAGEAGEGSVTDTLLDLRKGHILGNVKKLTAGSTFNVNSPAGVTAIRGSAFDLKLTEGIVNGTVKIRLTLNMLAGSATVTFVDDAGNTVSQVVLADKSFSTGAPGTTETIPPDVYAALEGLLAQMNVPAALIPRILTTDQTVVQVTTTTQGGTPTTTAGP